MKIGHYEPSTQEKGVNEFAGSEVIIPDGSVFWTVQTNKDRQFDVLRQEDAEILSRLVIIEQLLRKKK